MNGDFGAKCGVMDIMRILIFIGIILSIIFILAFALLGCTTMDREMMEWEGDYDCVVMQDSRVFCK